MRLVARDHSKGKATRTRQAVNADCIIERQFDRVTRALLQARDKCFLVYALDQPSTNALWKRKKRPSVHVSRHYCAYCIGNRFGDSSNIRFFQSDHGKRFPFFIDQPITYKSDKCVTASEANWLIVDAFGGFFQAVYQQLHGGSLCGILSDSLFYILQCDPLLTERDHRHQKENNY